MGVTKAEFQRVFGNGYTESFDAAGYVELKAKMPELIAAQANPEGIALDVGAGSCWLTEEWLVPHFKSVLALDTIRQPQQPSRNGPLHAKIRFMECGDQDYSCPAIDDDSIDFAHSLGCFCHLPNSANLAYLNSIYRVLKPGKKAILVFANWPNHVDLKPHLESGQTRNREEAGPGLWFYNDIPTVTEMTAQTGFKTFTDLLPGFRDLVALFSKE